MVEQQTLNLRVRGSSPWRRTYSDLGLYPFRALWSRPFPGHGCSTVARQSGPSRWDRANLPTRGAAFIKLVYTFSFEQLISHPAHDATHRETSWQAGDRSLRVGAGRSWRCRAEISLSALTPGAAGPAASPADSIRSARRAAVPDPDRRYGCNAMQAFKPADRCRSPCGCRKPMPPGDIHGSRHQRGHAAGPGTGPGR